MAFTPPAATGVQPGQAPLDNQQQSALAATLAKTGPPPNPKTLAQRTNPEYQWQAGLHSVRKALDNLLESIDERPDEDQTLITAMRHAADRLLKGVPGADTSLSLAAESCETIEPTISQQARQKLDELNRPPQVPGMPQLAGMMAGGGGAPQMGGAPMPPGGMPAGPPPPSPMGGGGAPAPAM